MIGHWSSTCGGSFDLVFRRAAAPCITHALQQHKTQRFSPACWCCAIEHLKPLWSMVVFDLPFRTSGIAVQWTKRTGFVQIWSFQIDLGHSTLHHRRAIPELQWVDGLINRTLPMFGSIPKVQSCSPMNLCVHTDSCVQNPTPAWVLGYSLCVHKRLNPRYKFFLRVCEWRQEGSAPLSWHYIGNTPGVTGPDNDNTPRSLCGPKISGPGSDRPGLPGRSEPGPEIFEGPDNHIIAWSWNVSTTQWRWRNVAVGVWSWDTGQPHGTGLVLTRAEPHDIGDARTFPALTVQNVHITCSLQTQLSCSARVHRSENRQKIFVIFA